MSKIAEDLARSWLLDNAENIVDVARALLLDLGF